MKELSLDIRTTLYLLITVILFSCDNKYQYSLGAKHFNNSEYELAILELEKIKENDTYYADAQSLLNQIDSLIVVQKEKQIVLDSIAREKDKIRLDSIEILNLKTHIDNIKKYKREKCYYVNCLREQMNDFYEWSKFFYQANYYSNEAKQLKDKFEVSLRNLQIKEFPIMRAEFASISKDGLWEDDITLKNYGNKKTTIEFIGGFFSRNRNIKNFHSSFERALREFRFKKAIYKWSKYSDEYTYYNLSTKDDSKI